MAFGLHKNHHEMVVLVLFAIAMAVTVSASTMDGLISYWPLDESAGNVAADVAGGHDGTKQGGAVWQSGKLGNCINTNGSGYIVIPEHVDLRPAAGVSMQAWVNISSFSMWYGIAGNIQDNGSNESGYYLYTTGSGVDWYVSVTSDHRFKTASTSASTGVWTHFVGTFDGGTVRLYKNGQLAASVPGSGRVSWRFMPLDMNIGRYHDDNENFLLNARIDEVALWGRALTQEEVTFLYNGGAGNRVDNSTFVKITESGGATEATEGGSGDDYEIVLGAEPPETVQITATPGDAQIDIGNGPGVPLVLDFTTENWQTPRTVSVAAFNDDIYEGKSAHKTLITHTADGGEYTGINVRSVDVSVIDNELICGDWGYFMTDLDRDCYVDLQDFAKFAMEWLKLPE
jgi:hypothetical protein